MDIGVGVSVDGVEWDVVKRRSPPSQCVSSITHWETGNYVM